MDYVIGGLPLHVLLVHGTVVIIPVAALCTVLSILWPAARRRLGIVTVLIALAALLMVPITQAAGEWLLLRIDQTPAVSAHVTLGRALLPWVIGVFAVALGQWLWFRYGATTAGKVRTTLGAGGSRIAAGLVVLLVLAVCGGTTAAVVQIGDTGSRAVWEGRFSEEPVLP
ncbi:DUF2231 domain-containing protein [Arthrobacter cavernae]|uniref:Uncharacterized protein n=1 Tax=Arthrobacter cavernae TaxID=2817681 RepID=A0A939HE94_9MICC|nr:DUF2231 domain-containing protein [Arthrobacter cavernae]MBO1269312.1 hypothetical protein [Arthrobacter cavernae]